MKYENSPFIPYTGLPNHYNHFNKSQKCYCKNKNKIILKECAYYFNNNYNNNVPISFCLCIPLYFQMVYYYIIYENILEKYKKDFFDVYLNPNFVFF